MFKERQKAEDLIGILSVPLPAQGVVKSVERKKETKNPPLLYNLAEIQNECSKQFKISPDQTLNIIQELYEKKLVTYPRTDARVLSTAVCKEIYKNIGGLKSYMQAKDIADEYEIDLRKSASILDIFSSVWQGMIPYGAQLLTAAGIAGISPFAIIKYLHYPILMFVCGIIAIGFGLPKMKSSKKKLEEIA